MTINYHLFAAHTNVFNASHVVLVSFSVCVITKFDVEMQSFGTYIHERNVTKRILMARYLLYEYFFMEKIFDHYYTVLTVYCTL